MYLVSSIVTGLVFVISVLFYPNTSILYLCAGDDFILTCITDTGTLAWNRVGGPTKTYSTALPVYANQLSPLGDHITVYLTNVSSSGITSVANITGAPLALNGTVIQCIDNDESKEKILFVSGKIIINLSIVVGLNFYQMVHCQSLT